MHAAAAHLDASRERLKKQTGEAAACAAVAKLTALQALVTLLRWRVARNKNTHIKAAPLRVKTWHVVQNDQIVGISS